VNLVYNSWHPPLRSWHAGGGCGFWQQPHFGGTELWRSCPARSPAASIRSAAYLNGSSTSGQNKLAATTESVWNADPQASGPAGRRTPVPFPPGDQTLASGSGRVARDGPVVAFGGPVFACDHQHLCEYFLHAETPVGVPGVVPVPGVQVIASGPIRGV